MEQSKGRVHPHTDATEEEEILYEEEEKSEAEDRAKGRRLLSGLNSD